MMGRTILLVDDEEDNAAAVARLLRLDAYMIFRASSATEGLAILNKQKVGVVISDHRMPGITGMEFLLKVKELYPNTMRILLSGYADHEIILNAVNQNAIYKVIAKPWDNDTLRAEVLGAFLHRELILEKEKFAE